MRGIDRPVQLAATVVLALAMLACADPQRDPDLGEEAPPGSGESDEGDDATGADDPGETGDGATSGEDGGGGDGDGSDGSPDGGDDTGGGDGGDDTGDAGDTGDTGGEHDGEIALFAINEGNFNGQSYVDQGIWSIMTDCSNPSFDAYMNTVDDYPELANAKHFVTGWSCGATYALIRGFEHSDVFSGIVHLNQASVPGYEDYLEQAFAAGGNVRVPVYVIHDFSYDAGGAYTIQWLESKGYEEGVDLFVMDRPGTGHEPYLTDEQKQILADWFRR
jgi:hypothetical protein